MTFLTFDDLPVTSGDLRGQGQGSIVITGTNMSMHIQNHLPGCLRWGIIWKKLNFAIFWSKVAQNDGRGKLEISNMQFLFIRILSITQMEASVKWAQNFSFEVPPLLSSIWCDNHPHRLVAILWTIVLRYDCLFT